jgi:ankyrin repeat protein
MNHNMPLQDGRCAAYIAAANGYVEILQLLIDIGADVNLQNDVRLISSTTKAFLMIIYLLERIFSVI